MPYSERLAERIRAILGDGERIEERKMFGGLAFMVAGHMACGVIGEDLMVRVGPEAYERALARAHVRPMDFTGKPLRGMVYVGPPGTRSRAMLSSWLDLAGTYVASLPAKKTRRAKRKR